MKVYTEDFKCRACKSKFHGTFSDYGGQHLNCPGRLYCPMCGSKLSGAYGDVIHKLHKLEPVIEEARDE